MKLNKKLPLFSLLTGLLSIIFLEAVLTLAAIAWPKVNQLLTSLSDLGPAQMVRDDHLRFRGNPEFPDHDSKGFRNPKVPTQADIVALGDSQTYGVWVERDDTWPRQLESIVHSTVYNMAVSGYGPVHSLILWDEALTLHPKIIIDEFYAGNDLFDAYDLVYSGGQFPELKSDDPIVQSRIQSRDSLDAKANQESADSDKELWFPRRLLSKYSKLYGLLRRTRHQVARIHDMRSTSQEKWEEAKIYAKNHPECCQVFDNGHARTIFTPDYRLRGLDQEDPRVREGRRISLMIMKRLHDLSVARDIRFIVLLMPTKELVFKELWRNPAKNYLSLTQNEEQFWKITKSFLKQAGIECLDALPALRKQASSETQPYFESTDGHPNKYGHTVLANLVAAYLKRTNNDGTKQRVVCDSG